MSIHFIFGHHNDLYFFRDRKDVRRCPNCSALLDKWSVDISNTTMPKRLKFEVSASYDGVRVVSERFRTSCDQSGFTGLVYRPLQNGYFAVHAEAVVPFDSVRRGTRFEKPCSVCGVFEQVAGATPVMLAAGARVDPQAFARTDVEFGSRDEKAPILLCGEQVAAALKAGKFSGLDMGKVTP